MAKQLFHLTPNEQRQLQALGKRIELARKRRKLTQIQMAERINVSRITYRKLEEGDPAVSLGYFMKAMNILSMGGDIDQLAKADELGRSIQDADLTGASRKNKP